MVARAFGETIREMREAQGMGLRTAAERLGISPAYLSRVERGKERPPRPDLVKRMATLLGGDPDLLFRLAESTDPDLAEYIHRIPNVPRIPADGPGDGADLGGLRSADRRGQAPPPVGGLRGRRRVGGSSSGFRCQVFI